jgi:hypothetical protein
MIELRELLQIAPLAAFDRFDRLSDRTLETVETRAQDQFGVPVALPLEVELPQLVGLGFGALELALEFWLRLEQLTAGQWDWRSQRGPVATRKALEAGGFSSGGTGIPDRDPVATPA